MTGSDLRAASGGIYRPFVCLWWGLLIGLFAAHHAWAQPNKSPNASRSPKARSAPPKRPKAPKQAAAIKPTTMQACRSYLKRWKALLALDKKGEDFYKRKTYQQALVFYKKAHSWLQQKAKGQTYANRCAAMYARAYTSRLAITYHWQRKFLKARLLYQMCSQQSPKKRQRKVCAAQVKRVERQLVQLHIQVLPKGAKLLLSRGAAPKSPKKRKWVPAPSPMKQWFLPGSFVLHMSHKGHASQREALSLPPGTKIKRTYRLQRAPCPPTSPPPILQLGGGQIMIIQPSSAAAVSSVSMPLKAEQQELHQDPLGQHPPLTPAQIALVVSGITAGAALVGLGVYGIYRLNTRIYSWTP